MKLQLFPESEFAELNKVYNSPVKVFYDFVDYWQSLQAFVNERKLVFWSKNL
jgi:hypothetical protein